MQTVSDRWESALRSGSALVVAKAEIRDYSGTLLASSEQAVGAYPKLMVVSGDVSVDVTADVQRRATVTFADGGGDFAPATPHDLLANTSGNELRLWRGLDYQDGTDPELKPLGVFGYSDDNTEDVPENQSIALTVYDRARKIQRAKFTETYTVRKDTNYVDAVVALLVNRWADIQINAATTTFLTPFLSYDPADDPWARAREMVKACGMDVFFDEFGVCQIVPITPVTNDQPSVFDYIEGKGATFVKLTRRSSNEGTYSGVIITGTSSSNITPPRGEAWDTNPSSATYADGPFGRVPLFETNEKVTSSFQAGAAAAARLTEVTGRQEIIDFDAFVNPAHQGRDLVYIKRGRSKVDARYELQSFNIPLRADGVMSALTKERRVA